MYYANINQKKSGLAILLSDNVDLKARNLSRTERHYIIIEDSNPKCVYSNQQSCQICEARTNVTDRRNRYIHNFSWRL